MRSMAGLICNVQLWHRNPVTTILALPSSNTDSIGGIPGSACTNDSYLIYEFFFLPNLRVFGSVIGQAKKKKNRIKNGLTESE